MNGMLNFNQQETNRAMGVFRKIIYGLVAISLLPAITTYFAYGSSLEMVYMGLSIGALIALVVMIFKPNRSVALWAFIFNILALIIQFMNVKFYWFEDKGGDPIVRVVFTILWLVLGVAVVLLFRESKILRKESN